MGVRVGADVGGTFTKAVAIDSVTGELAGRAVVIALRIGDGVIVEVGGTSTNVAAITGGRPALSYVDTLGAGAAAVIVGCG